MPLPLCVAKARQHIPGTIIQASNLLYEVTETLYTRFKISYTRLQNLVYEVTETLYTRLVNLLYEVTETLYTRLGNLLYEVTQIRNPSYYLRAYL